MYFLFSTDKCIVKSHTSDVILLKGHVGSDKLDEFPFMALSFVAKSSFFPFTTLFMNNNVPSVNSTCVDSKLPSVTS